jgi:hypothetical protein
MDEYFEQELIETYESAETILTLLFAFIDVVIIICSLFNLNSKNKKIYLLKYKLFGLFLVDIFLRIMYANKYHKLKSVYNEIIFTFLKTYQFFLILSFFEQIFNDTRLNKKGKFYKKLSCKQLCITFSLVTFSYEKFSNSQKEICLIQSLIIIYCIFVLYTRLRNKIIKIVDNLVSQKEDRRKKTYLCILGSPLISFIFYFSYYILRILFLTLENPDHIIYANIILKIIIDSSKYFLFSILELLLYVIANNKMQKEQYEAIVK